LDFYFIFYINTSKLSKKLKKINFMIFQGMHVFFLNTPKNKNKYSTKQTIKILAHIINYLNVYNKRFMGKEMGVVDPIFCSLPFILI